MLETGPDFTCILALLFFSCSSSSLAVAPGQEKKITYQRGGFLGYLKPTEGGGGRRKVA